MECLILPISRNQRHLQYDGVIAFAVLLNDQDMLHPQVTFIAKYQDVNTDVSLQVIRLRECNRLSEKG